MSQNCTDEELAQTNHLLEKIFLDEDLGKMVDDKQIALPRDLNQAFDDFLDKKLCEAFGIQPEDLQGDFMHEVRKYMYQDPL